MIDRKAAFISILISFLLFACVRVKMDEAMRCRRLCQLMGLRAERISVGSNGRLRSCDCEEAKVHVLEDK